jgi:hypothetical protein
MDKAKERIGIWPVAIYTFIVTYISRFVTLFLIGDNAPYWKDLVVSIVWGLIFGCLFVVSVKGYDRLKRKVPSS